MIFSRYNISLLLGVFLLLGCSTQPKLIDRGNYVAEIIANNPGQDNRVKYLIMHYTAANDAVSLKTLTGGTVSSHYLIPTKPKFINNKPIVLSLVNENKRAWHAGLSQWGNSAGLNDGSIGIEITNLGYKDEGILRYWFSYTPEQVLTITLMMKDIIQRYSIEPQNVLGHSDIAPQRKVDPGPLFPWAELAKQGIGAWPDEETVAFYLAGREISEPVDIANFQTLLAKYGYQTPTSGVLDPETQKVVSAFQMHFRASDIKGIPDAQSEAILMALIDKYRTKWIQPVI
ncbi:MULTISPECIES: peptidoglycan recognition protein family protein [Proteus]|uniref:peptidoglycan recognition protein family protein n=1 Tax=Proteus TaxID=583 RepID=UPI001378DC29|nr:MULTISPECIES: N-acetylmuramoyl-L-alanine amidase [Proteus]MCX2589313.1 N-acetylmuramoyl-L-alanine amidase [Proteus penneri]NBL78239.1 N-acetylmuramoyl-L-alanine amidase [Proteus sp. G2672]NBM04446.1 N-acetylmuramoyl-L-alanine amidase [Proteus sp. G2671]NBM59990.1 N-acetylmuramoyl-L-alanine amidase [Proteus sp. G2667]NBM88931.1 N-acetylmuramoyl-L-alanine amidase [Proteus sp. G2658]